MYFRKVYHHENNRIHQKDGSTVYRSSVYLGIDTVTGKKVKTTISGRTKRELKAKALQAQIDFEKGGLQYIKRWR